MTHRNFLPFLIAMAVCAGCGVQIAGEGTSTAVSDFVTSTLPPTAIPRASITPPPPTVMPTNQPIEGTSNTQVNVRSGPSTASASLGLVGAFEKVQVIGKDASGTWYQIVFGESGTGNGWVRAEYVQVDDPGKIQPVVVPAGSGFGVNGLVIEKINIRSGPGAEFESIALLSANDVVFITGKDASGEWAHIVAPGAAGIKGWAAIKFLKVDQLDALPILETEIQETATPFTATLPATQDGDSMLAPLAAIRFSPSGARALQVNGDVSAPGGDMEDWVQFTTHGNTVVIQMMCASDTLFVELWSEGEPVDDFSLSCGETRSTPVLAGRDYFLRLHEAHTGEFRHTHYILFVENGSHQ